MTESFLALSLIISYPISIDKMKIRTEDKCHRQLTDNDNVYTNIGNSTSTYVEMKTRKSF